MRLSPLRCGLVLVLVVAGCDHDCFEIEVRPAADAFQRKLTCWHAGDANEVSPLAAYRLERLGHLYPKCETPGTAVKQVFSGRFAERTPADVGGAGSYNHFTSPLGSAFSYVERFRGNDDLESRLAKRRRAAGALADLTVGWLEAELGRDPNFPKLKKFLAADFRRDLTNLGVYQFTGEVMEACRKGTDSESPLRAGLYLCERGYFSPGEIPLLYRALTSDDCRPLLEHVRRLLARKMGVADDQPVPASLAFLSDLSTLRASLEKYIRSTDSFQKRLADWKSASKDRRSPSEPNPQEVAGELLSACFGFDDLSVTSDSLELRLFCGQKPYATNGTWDERAAAAAWSASLPCDRGLPAVCFALWSKPDRAAQQAHFGKIVLGEANLAQYVIWYRGLKPEETRQWDEFVGGLKPGPGLKAAVAAFRFAADPKPDPKKPKEFVASLADTPRGLILRGLEGK
jgi:hypothetical protein